MSILSLFRKTPRLCENCKHWGTMSTPQELCECLRIAEAGREHHPAQLIPMDRDGDADDNVSLWTSGKFGCVHWEASATARRSADGA